VAHSFAIWQFESLCLLVVVAWQVRNLGAVFFREGFDGALRDLAVGFNSESAGQFVYLRFLIHGKAASLGVASVSEAHAQIV
jgi:hypothetical protein